MPNDMNFKSSIVGFDITGTLGTGQPATAAACIASPDMRLHVAAWVKNHWSPISCDGHVPMWDSAIDHLPSLYPDDLALNRSVYPQLSSCVRT